MEGDKVKLLVYEDEAAYWIDNFCKGGWRVRNEDNTNWIVMNPLNTKIRDETNSFWYEIECGNLSGYSEPLPETTTTTNIPDEETTTTTKKPDIKPHVLSYSSYASSTSVELSTILKLFPIDGFTEQDVLGTYSISVMVTLSFPYTTDTFGDLFTSITTNKGFSISFDLRSGTAGSYPFVGTVVWGGSTVTQISDPSTEINASCKCVDEYGTVLQIPTTLSIFVVAVSY